MTNIDKVERPKPQPREKSRSGQKGLVTYHRPAVLKQLKLLCIEQDKNQQRLDVTPQSTPFMDAVKRGKP